MKIRIPRRVTAAWDFFMDWANVVVIWRLRRLDFVMAALFVFCVSYYYWAGGWLVALQGGVLFIFIAMMALWVL